MKTPILFILFLLLTACGRPPSELAKECDNTCKAHDPDTIGILWGEVKCVCYKVNPKDLNTGR